MDLLPGHSRHGLLGSRGSGDAGTDDPSRQQLRAGPASGGHCEHQRLNRLVRPALFTQSFAHFIGPKAAWHLPGAPFLLAALMLLSAAPIAWRATNPGRSAIKNLESVSTREVRSG